MPSQFVQLNGRWHDRIIQLGSYNIGSNRLGFRRGGNLDA